MASTEPVQNSQYPAGSCFLLYFSSFISSELEGLQFLENKIRELDKAIADLETTDNRRKVWPGVSISPKV
jgi:hypothetical protein